MPTLENTNVRPEDLAVKSIAGQLSIDEAQGIVECFVSGVGNKDGVGDIVAPGAFDASLKRRKPRVVWGHDWLRPIGKVLEIFEVGPGDWRLPPKMKAAGIGGLYAKVQFNLGSQRGREAFNDILFFGEDQEWSIGYKTLDSEYDSRKSANILKELELFEVSPVLHGANNLTGTISIKSAEAEAEVTDDEVRHGLGLLKEYTDENPDWQPEIPEGIKRQFSEETRRSMAERGTAMPDGSYPIANANDLRNAIQAVGRAKDIEAAKRHIKKRARALGLTDLLPDDWKSAEEDLDVKIDVPGSEGASIGSLTGGRGPRRGNLEDLLDYWRPIMKKPGGFRRCLVILADHPELGPLPNLCAWLHHETTGKWPNEGNHHGRGKSEELSNAFDAAEGTLAKALADHFGAPVLVLDSDEKNIVFDLYDDVDSKTYRVAYAEADGGFLFGSKQQVHAVTTYRPFDDPDDHMPVKKPHPCKEGEPCECGGVCSTEKSAFHVSVSATPETVSETLIKAFKDGVEMKAGRVLSSRNMAKLQQAQGLLNEVVSSASREEEPQRVIVAGSPGIKDALETIAEFHNGYVDEVGSSLVVEVRSERHLDAIKNVVKALDGDFINSELGASSLESGDTE